MYTMDTGSILCCNNMQFNPLILQFNSPCNDFTSFWSIFVYNYIYATKLTNVETNNLRSKQKLKRLKHKRILKQDQIKI